MKLTAISLVFLALLATSPARAQSPTQLQGMTLSCAPLPHVGDDLLLGLNMFWGTAIPICALTSERNARADVRNGIVWANPDWLDEMAVRFGPYASTGILAHEWGHMVQGNVTGTAAELQADCLAGVFMRGMGLPWGTVEQFASAANFIGDAEWTPYGHGTRLQRVNASRRGYYGYVGQVGSQLVALCPVSAF